VQLYQPYGFRKDVTMSLPDLNKITDAMQRDRLNAQQEAQLQAYLASHPEQRTVWDEDLALNHLLRQVPDAPVSSNFTAQVLQALASEHRTAAPIRWAIWSRVLSAGWVPKLAAAMAVLCFGLLTYQQHQALGRKEIARSVAEISKLASGSSLEVLQNFDAIERLDQVPHAVDKELIAALQ
jgi:anti-sigma factor RsiW